MTCNHLEMNRISSLDNPEGHNILFIKSTQLNLINNKDIIPWVYMYYQHLKMLVNIKVVKWFVLSS